MTYPAYSRSPRYNVLKKRALEIFDRHDGWLSPPEWAVLAAFYPTRAAYSFHENGEPEAALQLLEQALAVARRLRATPPG